MKNYNTNNSHKTHRILTIRIKTIIQTILWFFVVINQSHKRKAKINNQCMYTSIIIKKIYFFYSQSIRISGNSLNSHSSSSPRPAKSPNNSIKYNCQKISSWSRRPKTILEIRKRPHFSRWSTILLFTSFSTLLTTERSLTGR